VKVACFGELLLRLSAPDHELLLQTPQLAVHIGGAEANVAVSLAQLGHEVMMVSVLPEGPLGRACLGELKRHGVNTDAIRIVPGRMGLYFLSVGAGHRPSEVLYDRESSAFALSAPELIDWDPICKEAGWLHVSGVAAALGAGAAQASLRAVRTARERDLTVSFDSNYRAKLWERWQGDPRAILAELVSHADLLFAGERDIALILGRSFGEGAGVARFERAAAEMLAQFPLLRAVATMARLEHSVDSHEISALSCSRAAGLCTTRTYRLERIIDRIGGGDAFAAGLLHGLQTGLPEQEALDFALAAACLKHSIRGDFNLASVADIQCLLRETGYGVRR
jgi:2-dehydro-3-deoxygluconokinase